MENAFTPLMSNGVVATATTEGGSFGANQESSHASSLGRVYGVGSAGDSYHASAFVPAGGTCRPRSHGVPGRLGLSSASAFTPLVRLRNIDADGSLFSAASSSSALPFVLLSHNRVGGASVGGSSAVEPIVSSSADSAATPAAAAAAPSPKPEPRRDVAEIGLLRSRRSCSVELALAEAQQPSPASPGDDSRSLRQKRKRNPHLDDQFSCPVCGVTLRPSEINAHFTAELDRLDKLYKNSSKKSGTLAASGGGATRSSQPEPSPPAASESSARQEICRQIRQNRLGRLAQGKGKGKGKRKQEDVACPVCSVRLPTGTSEEELSEHVELCLRKAENSKDEGQESEAFEEYNWAGVTRIRVTSMLPGGSLASCGFQVAARSRAADDDEEDLVVDGDDGEDEYGVSQYGEADVVPCPSEYPNEDKEREALRDAFISGSHGVASGNGRGQPSCSKWSSSDESMSAPFTAGNCDNGDGAGNECYKCLICMDRYTKPLVSTQCWHVLCEECWLRALGAKKLCPQCNMITSPSHLRRIYL